MVPSITDGLCTEMVLVYILKTQAAYMTFSGQQLLEPLADLLVPPLEPVTGNVVEAVVMDVHVKGEILPQHMNRAQRRTLRFVPDDAHLFIRHRLVRQRVLNEVSPDKWLEVAVLLGACAGMRRSEICGLKFSDINLDKNTVQIRRTVVKDENGKWVVQERTKTVKSKREIELPGFIIAKMWNQPRESEFVVPVKPDTVSKEFIDTRNALGFKCRFHDLRHYNASIMLALNVPDKYAMERMGYSTTATLKKVYQHTMAGKRAEVNSMINSHMNEMFTTGQSTAEKRESA